MGEQNKEGIPCRVVIEEEAGMLSQRIEDVDDETLVQVIDKLGECADVLTAINDDTLLVDCIDVFDSHEGG